MASTFRLPESLKAQAQAYADQLGISLNALMAVALRDYLDSRSQQPRAQAQAQAPASPAPAASPALAYRPSPDVRPALPAASAKPSQLQAARQSVSKVGPNQPCPCGSGQKHKRCHGKPGR